jgi:hypothetical protein
VLQTLAVRPRMGHCGKRPPLTSSAKHSRRGGVLRISAPISELPNVANAEGVAQLFGMTSIVVGVCAG